jgi:hypothetical protein
MYDLKLIKDQENRAGHKKNIKKGTAGIFSNMSKNNKLNIQLFFFCSYRIILFCIE